MSDPSHQDMDAIMEVMEAQQREQRVLSMLLEKQRSQARHHLVIQVRMGEISSYLTSVTLAWVADKVGFAADLPIFREAGEGSKRVQIDKEAIEQIQQRPTSRSGARIAFASMPFAGPPRSGSPPTPITARP